MRSVNIIAFLCVLLMAAPSWAQISGNSPDGSGLRLGVAGAYIPEYVGSADNEFRVLPQISFEDIEGFESNGLSIVYPLVDIGTGEGRGLWSLKAGPRAGFDFGRNSDDSPTLNGFEDIDFSLLAGGFARITYGIIGLRIDAGQDVINGHDGFVSDFSLGTFVPPGLIADNFSLQPAVTLSYADESYTQAFYGVTPAQAAASGLPAFDVGSGFHSLSGTLIAGYDLDDRWQLNAIVSYTEYIGDYRNSPILNAADGSRNNVFTLVGLTRRFGR